MMTLIVFSWILLLAVAERPQAVLDRAVADFRAGRITASVAGFDKLAKLVPDQAPQLWQRGIALYYAGRYQDCRAQFESHRTVNPNDVENAAWHFLCVARAESPEQARAALLPVGPDARIPMGQIYQMFGGVLAPEQVLAAAGAQPEAQFYAHLYVGLYFEALGNQDRAREHISAAAADRNAEGGGYMHQVARVHRGLVRKLAVEPPPAPKPHPDVRFHAKPKPLPAGAVTQDWESFLGPQHNGISTETKLLRDWPQGGPTLVWEMSKGTGYSSPAISGERLVYLHRVGNREKVECLHPETGARYWDFSYPTQFEDRYGYNNGPRASPVIDGDRVYTYGAEGKLHCLKLETGKVLWKRDIAADFRVPQDFFGTATTPLVEGDLLIVNVGAPRGPSVAAFHKLTGKMVWGAGDQWGASYASPVPATVHGERRIFVFAGGESKPPTGGLLSINPAGGVIDFTFPWRSRSYESVNAASPVVAGDQVFVSASYNTGGALLNVLPGGKHSVAWTSQEIGTHFNTAIHKDGYLYAFDGRNEPDASLVCVELKTGKVVWRVNPEWEETLVFNGTERRQRLGTYRGTLLAVDGHFLCLGELGHLLWLDLSPQGYKQLARAWLFAARETWSAPVLSRGLLYISQHGRDFLRNTPPRLLCYDLRGYK